LATSASEGVAAARAAEAALSALRRESQPPRPERVVNLEGTVTYKSTVVTTEGTRYQISVMDRMGFVSIFVVSDETDVTHEDGREISLDWIGQNDKVFVEYTIGIDNIKRARSVKKIAYFSSEDKGSKF
jgi:hypothetical protein